MTDIFLGSHGQYVENSLTREGLMDAGSMAVQLYNQGINPDELLIISSASQRAVQTAFIMASVLCVRKFMQSYRLEQAGFQPEIVETMGGFIGSLLASRGIRALPASIAVVTHEPLVDAMIGGASEYGTIYKVPADLKNPTFDSEISKPLDFGLSLDPLAGIEI